MKNMQKISVFQEECLKKTQDLIRKIIKKQTDFETINGRSEIFLKLSLFKENKKLDIYIYEDEAGYMINNKEWKIFEKSDYPSSKELLKHFLLSLGDWLKE